MVALIYVLNDWYLLKDILLAINLTQLLLLQLYSMDWYGTREHIDNEDT